MIYLEYYKSIILIGKVYNIPTDISYIIYNHFINLSAQIIINSWYNYIMIHNINLVHIISQLKLYMNYDSFGMPYFYYNLYDKKVGITFNICYKYIDFSICDIEWWIHRITYAFNALPLFNDINNSVFKYNYDAIANFYNNIEY